jgi:hypothetical protein
MAEHSRAANEPPWSLRPAALDRSASAWCRGLVPRGSPRRCPPRGRGRGGGRRRPRRAAHDVESAQAGGLLQLFGQVVEQAGGRNRRLSRQPFDQAVHHHVGEPFDLRIDGRNRLVGQHPGCTSETGHARINSSQPLLTTTAGIVPAVRLLGGDRSHVGGLGPFWPWVMCWLEGSTWNSTLAPAATARREVAHTGQGQSISRVVTRRGPCAARARAGAPPWQQRSARAQSR